MWVAGLSFPNFYNANLSIYNAISEVIDMVECHPGSQSTSTIPPMGSTPNSIQRPVQGASPRLSITPVMSVFLLLHYGI